MSSTAYRHVCLTNPRLIVALPDAVFRRLVLAVQAFPRFYTRRIKHRACNREGLLGSGCDDVVDMPGTPSITCESEGSSESVLHHGRRTA